MTTDTLWYTRCPSPRAFSVAVELGWLEEEFSRDGIRIQSLAASTDRAVRQSHFELNHPRTFRHGGPIPALISASRGADIAIIGLSWNLGRDEILAMPGSGIRSVADLRGKRIGLPRRNKDSVDFWRAKTLRAFNNLLAVGGLAAEDVTFVDIDVNRAFVDEARSDTSRSGTLWDGRFMLGHQREDALALARGEVDVIYSGSALSTVLQAVIGAQVVFDLSKPVEGRDVFADRYVSVFSVSGDLARSRPDLAARALKQALRVNRDADRFEDAIKRISAREAGIPEDILESVYGADMHRRLTLDLAADKRQALQAHADLLQRQGFLEKPVEVEPLIVDLSAYINDAA